MVVYGAGVDVVVCEVDVKVEDCCWVVLVVLVDCSVLLLEEAVVVVDVVEDWEDVADVVVALVPLEVEVEEPEPVPVGLGPRVQQDVGMTLGSLNPSGGTTWSV